MQKAVSLIVGLLFVLSASEVPADPKFYEGKTLTIVSGYPPGGGYSAYALVISRHLTKHIPGRPKVIVQYMPGGSSLVAANNLFNRTEPDGLTIGAVNMNIMYSAQILKSEGALFDIAKWKYIGSAASQNYILVTKSKSPYSSLKALKEVKQPARIGYMGKGSDMHVFGSALEEGLGVKFRSIFGYRGGGEVDMGMERGDIDGRVANLSSFLIEKGDWVKNGFVKILVQAGTIKEKGKLVRDADIPDVPMILELSSAPRVKQLRRINALAEVVGKLYVAPPKTPDDRVKILRQGFLATLADPAFLAEANQLKIDTNPIDGSEIETLVKDAMQVDSETVEFLKSLRK
ncbi:MAG: hypothetical protein HY695_22845 [Deltaproteobacteria bacterium]|nr:hypothetical protein [Deltaproteobacteria bacterium]